MRKALFTLLAVLTLCCGCAAQEESAPQFISTACNHTFLKNGEVTGTDDYYYTYNDQGLVTDSERYEDGILTEQSHWEYDEFRNCVRITSKRSDAVEITEYRNTLDEGDRILRQEVWTNDVLTSIREITYNRQGKETTHHATFWHNDGQLDGSRTDTTSYNWKGEPTRQVVLWDRGDQYIAEYQDGLVIRQTSYEAETNAVTDYWEYAYDQKDRCIRESRYDGNGTLELYHEYVYDDVAQTKTRICYYTDGTVDNYSDVYTYD